MKAIKPNDTIALVAPGRRVNARQLADIVNYIKALGLKVDVPADMTGEDLFSSNTAEYRFEHLKRVIEDDNIKAIWCVKGGYGSGCLIPLLEKMPKPKQQKMFIGFSDITALHLFFMQRWGWQVIHGPVLWQIATKRIDTQSAEWVSQLLLGNKTEYEYALLPMNDAANETDEIAAPVTGGNLSLVQTSIGTSWHINSNDKIVLLEDLDERPYFYDRTLEHLKQANVFAGAKAILLGDFLTENGEEENLQACLERFAKRQHIPVFALPGVGHAPTNYALPLGVEAKLSGDRLTVKM